MQARAVATPSSSVSQGASLRVGVLVSLSAVVLLATLMLTGPCGVHFGKRVAVDYAFAGPIKRGAAVRVSGQVVGAVEEVEFLAGQHAQAGEDIMVRVHLNVDERAWPVLTDKARYYVTTLGVLGEHYVDIEPKRGGTPLKDGDVVRGVDLARADLLLPRVAGMTEIFKDLVDNQREDVTRLMRVTSTLLTRVDDILKEADIDEMQRETEAMLAQTRDVLKALHTAVGDGQQLQSALSSSTRALHRADALLAQVSPKEARAFYEQSQGALVDGRAALSEGRVALGEGREALAEGRVTLRKVDGALDDVKGGPLTDAKRQKELARTFEKTFVALEKLSLRADRLMKTIEKREGAVGKAFYDEQLTKDLKEVLGKMRENPVNLFFQ